MARPNVRELMDATGLSAYEAGDLLYGVVGSNVDTRNWDAIMASDDITSAAQAATSQMVNSREDNSTIDPANDYHGSAVQKSTPSDRARVEVKEGRAYVYGANGTLMRTGTLNSLSNPNAVQQLLNVGASISDLQAAANSAGVTLASDVQELSSSGQDFLLDPTTRKNIIAKAKAEADRQRPLRNYEAARNEAESASRQMQVLLTGDATPEARQAAMERLAGMAQGVEGDSQGFNNYGFYLNPQTAKLRETRFEELYANNLQLDMGLPSFERKEQFYQDDLTSEYFQGVKDRLIAKWSDDPRWQKDEDNVTSQGTLGPVEQTITAPETPVVGTTTTLTQPTYTDTTTTGVTQTPTTETGAPTAVSPGTTPTTGTTYPQQPVTGTFPSPVQTGGVGSVPSTTQTLPNYTGTTMSNLTSQSQGGFGGIKKYKNAFGQEISVTVDASGNPLTFVPPGYTAAAEGGLMGFAKGGLETDPIKSSEDIYLKIAQKVMNFQGDSSELKKQMAANPALAAKLGSLTDALTNMATTRMGAAPGTDVGNLSSQIGPEQFKKMQQDVVTGTMVPPQQAAVQQITPQAEDFIPTTAGMAPDQADMAQAATVGTVQQAQMPQMTAAGTMTPTTVTPQVQAETDALQAQTGTIQPGSTITPQQQLTTSITGMQAATGESVDVTGAPTRTMQVGERVEGTGVDQAQVAQAFGTGEVQAASVQDELAGLMQQFEGGDTPAWAAGSMRAATQMLAARGLGASSLAGQAVIQAAMEAALPIAQIDAGNKQQMALFKAEQRAKFLGMEFDQAFQAKVMNAAKVSEIANMQFSADQQIALENSRAANTMELNNLSNQQAMVMAEAAALSQLDMANLNNRQQSAVQNAQNFLQMDMANLNNQQQTAMFKAQQNIQALFTDQAAENAAAQFNATSENQTNQFFASLSAQTSQFNASQANAMDQFNTNSINALRQFNAEMQNQRTMFNAQNGLVIAQANAQWRQNIATMNTAAINESNMTFAQTMNELTATNLDEIWQRERDLLSMAFQVSENNANRSNEVLLQKIAAQAQKDAAELQADLEAEANTGDFIKEILVGISGWS